MGFWEDFVNALADAGDLVESTAEFGGAIKNLGTAIDGLSEKTNNYLRGLEKQIAVNQKLNEEYISAAKQTLVLERRNAQLNKSFGIGVKQAAMLSAKMQVVANDLKITGVQAGAYAGNIKKMLPTFDQFSAAGSDMYKSLQQTQHVLKTNIGLTDDAANSYTQYAEQNGKSSSSMLLATKRLAESLDPDGTMGYFKMITEEIAATGNEIQLQYGKIPGNLEVAVLKAKKLGFTLEDLAGTADELLNIESSIGNELEYQLLSGRRLVDNQGNSLTNMYREAALRGDMNKQADIMNNILETEGKTIENNMFARKQLALTLGIEERQLASALQKKKILEKAAASGIDIDINASDTGKALAQAAAAVEKGAISQGEFKELVDATDTRSTEDIMKQQLEQLQEQTMLSALQLQASYVANNQQEIFNKIQSDPGYLMKLAKPQLEAIGKARRGIAGAEALKNAAEDARKGSATPYDTEPVDTGDAVITPGYGKRVLTFPEDTLQAPLAFNDNDTIVAGTNLTGKGGGAGPDMAQFAAMIVAAINTQTRALKSNATFSGGINAPYYG
jgi:hypothetical protein